jgi:rubrerythrin
MTTVVTQETGGRAKPVGVLYIEPDRQVVDAGASTALAGSGLDPAFTADLLSACLAHERCGAALYRSVATRTASVQLQERYEHFEAETLDHVRLLEGLIAGAGGDPQYVSPSARATEAAGAALLQSTFLFAGAADMATAELSMLEAVMLAEAKDRANWLLLAELAAQVTDPDLQAQFQAVTAPVLAQEEEHYGWASDTRADMLFTLATGAARAGSGEPGDVLDLTSMTRDELYATAQELDIEGRSRMNKDELAEAVADETGATR